MSESWVATAGAVLPGAARSRCRCRCRGDPTWGGTLRCGRERSSCRTWQPDQSGGAAETWSSRPASPGNQKVKEDAGGRRWMPDEDAPQRIGQERKRKRGNTNSQERRNEEEGVGKREKGNRHNGNGGRGPRLLDEARRSRASFGRKANHDASLLAAGWCSSSTSLLRAGTCLKQGEGRSSRWRLGALLRHRELLRACGRLMAPAPVRAQRPVTCL